MAITAIFIKHNIINNLILILEISITIYAHIIIPCVFFSTST